MHRRDLSPLEREREVLGHSDRVLFRMLGLTPAETVTREPLELTQHDEKTMMTWVTGDLPDQSIESSPSIGIHE